MGWSILQIWTLVILIYVTLSAFISHCIPLEFNYAINIPRLVLKITKGVKRTKQSVKQWMRFKQNSEQFKVLTLESLNGNLSKDEEEKRKQLEKFFADWRDELSIGERRDLASNKSHTLPKRSCSRPSAPSLITKSKSTSRHETNSIEVGIEDVEEMSSFEPKKWNSFKAQLHRQRPLSNLSVSDILTPPYQITDLYPDLFKIPDKVN
jgi:hypothetical protein